MSRKYRQKGYQDEDRAERDRRPAAPSERREGPRGRGLGSPSGSLFRCRDCGQKIPAASAVEIEHQAVCAGCGAALHSCVNCAHLDPSARYECRQDIPARVSSKTKANPCGLFAPKLVAEIGGGNEGLGPDDPRAAFDALFK